MTLPLKDAPQLNLLMLPGIGDLHWIFLKLAGMRQNPKTELRVHVWEFEGRPRSIEFVRKVPFLTAAGYVNLDKRLLKTAEFRGVYLTGSHTVVPAFDKFDYLIGLNGVLVNGKSMIKDILPHVPTDWDYPITESEEEKTFSAEFTAKYPNYGLFFFSNHGMFGNHWIPHLTPQKIQMLLEELHKRMPNTTQIYTGSLWDGPMSQRLPSTPYAINLVGQTSLDQLIALIRKAKYFVGFCGGNTIVSTHLKTPTCMIWSKKQFPIAAFRWNWVKPGALNKTYIWKDAETIDVFKTAEEVYRMVQTNR